MKRLLAFLKDPPLWFAALIWAGTFAAAGGSIAAVATGDSGGWVYAVYLLAAVFLAYGIYLAVRLTPRMKEGILERANRHAFTGQFVADYGFRTQVFALCSFLINVGCCVYHLVFAVLWRSAWFGALSGYYFLLGVLRGVVLLHGRRAQKGAEGEALLVRKWRIFRLCGAALLVLEIALTAFVAQATMFARPLTPSIISAIVSAAYTFYSLIIAVVQLFKVRRTGDPLLQALRNINFSNALVSLFALEITLVAATGDASEQMRFMNIATGFCVCVAVIGIGIYMIVRASRWLRRAREEDSEEV